ncbi:MAG: hypothetical protein R3E32_21280 [Chitinophagales bacterium]
MELRNTIELNPYDYASSEYEYPNGSSKDLPEEWAKFWKNCLLNAIKMGSYKNSELKEILK